jgi:hypothetical protein
MIAARLNNCLGAVYAALYSFRMARQAAINSSWSGTRRDTYSILLYKSTATQTSIMNDLDHTPDQLLQELLLQMAQGGLRWVVNSRVWEYGTSRIAGH